MFGALMTLSDQVMNSLPNIHLIGMFVMLLTVVYRAKALIPIYLFVVLDGLLEGFYLSTWIMYSYIWLILWAVTMLLPRNMPRKVALVVYPTVCALHGLTFGMLTAPVGFLMFYPETMWTMANYWRYVTVGLVSFDLYHAFGNLAAGLLILPLADLLRKLERK